MANELWQYTASELAALIRDKEVSSREVITSHLERINAVNDKVNGVTVTLEETALAAADKADSGTPTGPFYGVPFTIKENIDCTGSATTNGIPAFAAMMPQSDAPTVARMKAAGAIPLARTNLPEMGLRITTDNPLRGRTNNPYDMTRTSGGSSGGEGVALATGMSPIGLGNDIGGSLRNPAYCCGITSLKPTTGRIPLVMSIPAPTQPLSFRLMAVEGPMARSVADLKLAYGELAGWHPKDPFSAPAPLTGPTFEKRAALVTKMPFGPLPDETSGAIQRAGEILASAGWHVEEAEAPELEYVSDIWAQILTMDLHNTVPILAEIMSPGPMGFLQRFLAKYPPGSMDITTVFSERDRLAIAWSEFFQTYPAVIGPTWGDLPFLHDADLDEISGVETLQKRLAFITPGNALGIPAIALPMGESNGLATGIQIYGDRWREDVCFAAAEAIEQVVGHAIPIDPRY